MILKNHDETYVYTYIINSVCMRNLLIDWLVCYAVSAIFHPYNGGD